MPGTAFSVQFVPGMRLAEYGPDLPFAKAPALPERAPQKPLAPPPVCTRAVAQYCTPCAHAA
eukprot:312889-Rhodomonas_salina.1